MRLAIQATLDGRYEVVDTTGPRGEHVRISTHATPEQAEQALQRLEIKSRKRASAGKG